MLGVLLIVLLIILICFSMVIFYGAPYLPTLKPHIDTTFEIAGLKEGDTILELGCGDGKVLIAAAKAGINSVGYELNPIMAFIAWLRTIKYRKYVKVIWGDIWSKPWPEADAIFVFLLQRFMKKLDTKCMQYPYKPVKLLSFAFEVPGRKPVKVENAIFMYEYTEDS